MAFMRFFRLILLVWGLIFINGFCVLIKKGLECALRFIWTIRWFGQFHPIRLLHFVQFSLILPGILDFIRLGNQFPRQAEDGGTALQKGERAVEIIVVRFQTIENFPQQNTGGFFIQVLVI